jgi:hypothetical protein
VVLCNHFIFDALAGVAVLGLGFMITEIPKIRHRGLGYT